MYLFLCSALCFDVLLVQKVPLVLDLRLVLLMLLHYAPLPFQLSVLALQGRPAQHALCCTLMGPAHDWCMLLVEECTTGKNWSSIDMAHASCSIPWCPGDSI